MIFDRDMISELCAGFILALVAAVLIFAGAQMTRPAYSAWQNVAQEWEQYFQKNPNLNRDQVKGWFKSVRSPHGVPCCDWSDGHPTEAEPRKDNHYWIPDPIHLEEPRQWIQVPSEAVVYDAGNPIGEPVVWYVQQGPDSIYIRCFVPGGGV